MIQDYAHFDVLIIGPLINHGKIVKRGWFPPDKIVPLNEILEVCQHGELIPAEVSIIVLPYNVGLYFHEILKDPLRKAEQEGKYILEEPEYGFGSRMSFFQQLHMILKELPEKEHRMLV